MGDVCDNCPNTANTDQSDIDDNGTVSFRQISSSSFEITCFCLKPFSFLKQLSCLISSRSHFSTISLGYGDACDTHLDFDGDGVQDAFDNCPYHADASQLNTGNDWMDIGPISEPLKLYFLVSSNFEPMGSIKSNLSGNRPAGDVCDDDIDGDGFANDIDLCPYVNKKRNRDIYCLNRSSRMSLLFIFI